ncbi:MAG: hypothetical protein EOP06_26640 [Proteobacteria bacterium]|nr:MAG: hypothetical protein EOP06_26640 [Pseudomonadota bacterium]
MRLSTLVFAIALATSAFGQVATVPPSKLTKAVAKTSGVFIKEMLSEVLDDSKYSDTIVGFFFNAIAIESSSGEKHRGVRITYFTKGESEEGQCKQEGHLPTYHQSSKL